MVARAARYPAIYQPHDAAVLLNKSTLVLSSTVKLTVSVGVPTGFYWFVVVSETGSWLLHTYQFRLVLVSHLSI